MLQLTLTRFHIGKRKIVLSIHTLSTHTHTSPSADCGPLQPLARVSMARPVRELVLSAAVEHFGARGTGPEFAVPGERRVAVGERTDLPHQVEPQRARH